uniref:Disease resistance R13L4/SHOC-2-like LRR domain-containing protein n=1 Tax=Strigamia maritima TaxID=126957 RepID=T1J7G9_STRMM
MFWDDRRVGACNASANPLFDPDTGAADLHSQMVKQARKSGNLNLSNRGWTVVPDKVWNINTLSTKEVKALSYSMDETDGKWWEQVDLSQLNLANNQISQIPSDISNLAALQVLDLHDNKLIDLPQSLGTLERLTKLDISHNQLAKIPCCVLKLFDLRILLAQNNQLSEVCDEIADLNRLKVLDLSNNNLKTLPINIGFLSTVEKINLSFNKLDDIPHEIGSMTALQTLDLSNNNLSTVPAGVGELIHLTQLYLRHNKLTNLPILKSCSQLKELFCGHNLIAELSQEAFEPLLNVKILELNDNRINFIPSEIIRLSTLERLDLRNNLLTNLPSVLGIMPQLVTLSVEGNALKCIRRDLIQRGTSQVLKFLRSRFEDDPEAMALAKTTRRPLSGEYVAEQEAFQLDRFTIRQSRLLSFSNKQLKEIPDNIFETAAECEVSNIVLSKNLLRELPESLSKTFKRLRELDLSYNQLASVPLFLSSASRLVFLDLRSNHLETLPSEFSQLQLLREICISNNKFKEIPSCLFSLTKLEILMASDNKIKTINADGLSGLLVLAVLDLKNNDISTVPPELGNMTQLRTLHLEGNCFRLPRLTILDKGTEAILSYLRDKIPT